MTILDYDRREKRCPVCNKESLIFITDAPNLRPIGKTVQYRCKDCAIREAEVGSDPLYVIQHRERKHVPCAWKTNRRPDQPTHLRRPATVAGNVL